MPVGAREGNGCCVSICAVGSALYKIAMNEKVADSIINHIGLPDFFSLLFWEYDPGTIDIIKHDSLIMGRIMERGSWASMAWLQKTYSREQLGSFLEKRGNRILPPRELNYWALMCGIPSDKKQKWLKDAREKHDVWRDRHSH